MNNRFNHELFQLFENAVRNLKARPLDLGGFAGTGGGEGGAAGGYIGYLPQTRVAYDTDELASSGIVGSGTLLDNLNHIRYRIEQLELSSGILNVDDGVTTVNDVTELTFSGGAIVTELSPGHALVTVTASGGSGTPLTVQSFGGGTVVNNVDKITIYGALVADAGDGDVSVVIVPTYTDISANDSDTDVTGAELEELTDGSETTLHSHAGNSSDGWSAGTGTWTYASADDPTFTLTVNADVTGAIGVGDKIKLTQTTVKYFIVTAISYSAPNTTITLYGGTDYDLANAAISNPYYSHAKSPLGFPVSPAKWTVTVTDTTQRSQTSPTQNTWYNIGSLSISIPIGVWDVAYKVTLRGQITSNVTANMFGTLSTANNSESDADFTTAVQITTPTGTVVVQNGVYTSKNLTLASKTTYYLNGRTTVSGQDHIMFRNDISGLIITARCAYL